MQVFQGEHKLGPVESRFSLAEVAFAVDELVQVAAIDKIDHEVEMRPSLESTM